MNGSNDYSLARHRRPAENFKALLLPVSDHAQSSQGQEVASRQGSLQSIKLRFRNSEDRGRIVVVDLSLLLLALSVLVYLSFRLQVIAISMPEEKAVELSVFSDELMDLTGLDRPVLEQSASVMQSAVQAIIESEGLKQHVQITAEDEYLSLQINSRVLFNAGSYDLARSGKPILESLLTMLRKQLGHVTIEVHTNGQAALYGEMSSQQDLSERRAESLMDYFVAKGLLEARLSAEGYGNSRPISIASTTQAEDQNPRVTLKIGKVSLPQAKKYPPSFLKQGG